MTGYLKSISAVVAVAAAVLFFTNCENLNDPDSTPQAQVSISRQIFSDLTTEFIVKVVYEVGATPYTGNIGITANDTWDITKSSFQAVFQNHTGRVITVPSLASGFTQIPDKLKTSWTTSELIALGTSVSPATLVTSNKATVTVIFLNGLFEGNAGTLGVHFSGYGFAFIFKDVIAGVGGTAADQRYVEQATVVHEIGHLIGFVNNGVPLTSSYEDSAHLRHSTNTSCVMYWSVESSTTILSSLTNSILAARLNLFEAEPLNDGRAFHP